MFTDKEIAKILWEKEHSVVITCDLFSCNICIFFKRHILAPTSAEVCEKCGQWLWKESCVSTGVGPSTSGWIFWPLIFWPGRFDQEVLATDVWARLQIQIRMFLPNTTSTWKEASCELFTLLYIQFM